jgi:hypothetical protein
MPHEESSTFWRNQSLQMLETKMGDVFFPNADVNSVAVLGVVLVFRWKFCDVSEERTVSIFQHRGIC